MEVSAAPEALVAVPAARDKWTARVKARVCHFLERAKESGANQAQPNVCKTNRLQERPNQRVMSVDNAAAWPATLDALERVMQSTRLGQTNPSPHRDDFRANVTVERCGQSDVVSSCLVCAYTLSARPLSRNRNNPLSMHTHTLVQQISEITYLSILELFLLWFHLDLENLVSLLFFPCFLNESRKLGRSVMESAGGAEHKSDLGLGIIDTACLFCVAGSDRWTNNKNLLENVGLRHEIHENLE